MWSKFFFYSGANGIKFLISNKQEKSLLFGFAVKIKKQIEFLLYVVITYQKQIGQKKPTFLH